MEFFLGIITGIALSLIVLTITFFVYFIKNPLVR